MIRKILIVFTILLNSICGSLYACGPYFPNGEDIRFNMLKPKFLNVMDLMHLIYPVIIITKVKIVMTNIYTKVKV